MIEPFGSRENCNELACRLFFDQSTGCYCITSNGGKTDVRTAVEGIGKAVELGDEKAAEKLKTLTEEGQAGEEKE